MATAGTLEYLISVDSSKLSRGLSSAEGLVKGFGNKMSALTVAAGNIVGNIVTSVGRATADFAKGAMSESMDFDKSMSQVAATLGKSTAEVQELAKFARQMGAETAFTATEAAQALNYMALAGYDTEKSMKMLPTVLNLAAAGNMELANASDMVTDAQSALGLSIEQTEQLVDQMAKTSSKTNTSVSQLGDAILTVGGTAKMLKGGTTELTEILGVLADNGIKGSEGGTALRNVLLSLTAPTDKAAKQLKKLKIDVFDAEGNMRDLPSILEDINAATKDMTQEERTNFLSEVFNKRDLKSVEALLGTSKKRWQELAKEIGGASGSAGQMAETQLDNLAGDVTKFNSALGETKLALIEGLTPSLRNFVQTGTKLVSRLTNAFKKGGLKGVIQDVGTIFKNFVGNLKSSENPALQAAGKIASLITEGLTWDNVKAAAEGAWQLIQEGVANLGGLIFGKNTDGTVKWPTWDDVKEAAEGAWKVIKEGVEGLGGLVFGFDETGAVKWPTWDDVKEAASTAWDTISTGLGSIAQWVLGTPDLPSANEVGQAIKKWWDDNVAPLLNGVLSFLFGIPSPEDSTGEDTKAAIVAWWDNFVVPLLKGALDFVLGLFGLPSVGDMVKKIEDWWENVKKDVGNLFINIIPNILGINKPVDPNTSEYGASNAGTDEFSVTSGGGGINMPQKQAKGDWYVPYDNYLSLLHRGEMVLTKSQARQYRDGDNGVNAEDLGFAVASAVDQAMSKVLVMMSGEKVGDLTTKRVKKNINASTYNKLRAYGG